MTAGPESVPRSGSDRERDEYAALVRDATGGDRLAMERLLMRAQAAAYRFSTLVCGHPEDAEDVMQDALLKTFQHVRRLDDPGAFRTWLYATVRNACLMKRRRRAGEPAGFVPLDGDRRISSPPVDVPDQADAVDARLMAEAAHERLRAALARLPPAARVIVALRDIEGLSTRETAAVTGYSEANVKQRLHRARLGLRNILEGGA